MAQVVRTQVTAACFLVAAWIGTGCSDANGHGTPASEAGAEPQDEMSKAAAAEAQTPTQAIHALVERCHGVLKGKANLANSSVKLRRAADDEVPEQVLLADGSRMKFVDRNREIDVRLEQNAWHIKPQQKPVKLEGDALAKLDRLQGLVRAALLAPLYEFEKVSRQGPNIYALIMPGGATWRLEVAAFTPPGEAAVLLPLSLTGPPGKLQFEEYLHTGVTHLPAQVVLGEFGRRWFSLELSGVAWSPSVFTDPEKEAKPSKSIVKPMVYAPDPKPGVAMLKNIAAMNTLIFEDPGDWASRIELLKANGGDLATQGQESADLDFFYEEDGKRMLAMPFQMLPAELGGKPFVRKETQRIARLPSHRAVLVYPKNGTMEDCEKEARRLITVFLAEKKLEASGPLRIIPWIDVAEGVPSERKLRHLRIGFEQPVR